MVAIVIVYDSGQGHTRKLAQRVASGAGAVLLPVNEIGDDGWQVLDRADAIVFGTPTYMGGVSSGFKAFMDATGGFWEDQPWRDKLAAGFTIGTNMSGDKLVTLQHLAVFAAQHGMIWVGQDRIGPRPEPGMPRGINADGSWLGLMATSSPDKQAMIYDGDATTAVAFGQRIAATAARWTHRPEERPRDDLADRP